MTPTQKLLEKAPTVRELLALARELKEHNKWRRGVPPYDEIGAEPPLSGEALGDFIDMCAAFLRLFARLKSAAKKDLARFQREMDEAADLLDDFLLECPDQATHDWIVRNGYKTDHWWPVEKRDKEEAK